VVAAAGPAGSLWLVCVDRDGMRNAIVPLFGGSGVHRAAALGRAARRAAAILAGAVTSLAALYTYQPLKLLPVLGRGLAAVAAPRRTRVHYDELRAGPSRSRQRSSAVAAPMIAVAVTEPANYFGRAAATSAFNPTVEADSNR